MNSIPLSNSNAMSAAADEEASLDGVRILLVDDVSLNLQIEEYLLTDLGAIVTPAGNGEEALQCFLTHPSYTYDVILMDLRMPVMDGLEATRLIRASTKEDAVSIPIIALTATDFSADPAACHSCGMTAHVSKPLNKKMVCRIIHETTHR